MSDTLRGLPRHRWPTTGSGDPVAAIARAVAATEAAHTARVVFVDGFDMSTLLWPGSPAGDPVGPGAPTPLGPFARRFARGLARLLSAGDQAEGVVDFDRRLLAMDYGFYAEFVEAGREWRGRSGRLRSTLPERSAGWAQPLWLVDLLYGAVAAVPAGDEAVRGEPCVRVAGRADLARATRESGREMAVPEVPRAEDLTDIPIECWIDSSRLVRRIRAEVNRTSFTAELFDFGVWVDRDWPDMPTFRTPAADRE